MEGRLKRLAQERQRPHLRQPFDGARLSDYYGVVAAQAEQIAGAVDGPVARPPGQPQQQSRTEAQRQPRSQGGAVARAPEDSEERQGQRQVGGSLRP